MNRSRSTSSCRNLRYPDGVRSGSTRPCSSRKRILEIVTSGNSVRSVDSTSPMLIGEVRPACRRSSRRWASATGGSPPGVGLAPGRARVEDHPVLADLHLVAVAQHDLVDPVALHIGAVEAADIANREPPARLAHELRVLPGDRDVVEEDVAVRAAACRGLVAVQEEPRA